MREFLTDEATHVLKSGKHMNHRSWKSKSSVKPQTADVHIISASWRIKLPIWGGIVGQLLLGDTEERRGTARDTCHKRVFDANLRVNPYGHVRRAGKSVHDASDAGCCTILNQAIDIEGQSPAVRQDAWFKLKGV